MSSIHIDENHHSSQIALVMVVLSLLGFVLYFATIKLDRGAHIDLTSGRLLNERIAASEHPPSR